MPGHDGVGTVGAGAAGGLQILLVDDDAQDVALVEQSLLTRRPAGRLHHVSDGIQALEFLRRRGVHATAPRPDLVLLDLNMPRMDGREVLTIVKTDPQLRLIPVIVFTTSSSAPDVLASYANSYITKPNDLDTLDHVIEKVYDFYSRLAARPAT